MHRSFLIRYILLLTFFFAMLAEISCQKTVVNPNSNNTNNNNILPLPGTFEIADTLNIMAYNILYYGNGCQGASSFLDSNFRIIIQYTQPDILSCEKMQAFDPTPGVTGNLAEGLVKNVLNASFPNRYAYAVPTNESNGKGMSVLFYNQLKLGYLKTVNLVKNITDFDMYKLYYKDINLSVTRDTSFLYVIVNHTQSGSSSSNRDLQLMQEMNALRSKFTWFPNLINMGDFNTANSYESGYQQMVSSTDSTTLLSDPPYYPDNILTYPGNWDIAPFTVASFLTTSTRMYADAPNSCGTSGGAKGWFDHIFISPWIIKGSNYIKYIPLSYHTVGNDGNRLGVSINSPAPVVNSAVSTSVADALYQFSNKYPVMLKLAVTGNRSGNSQIDPVEK